MQGLLWPAIAKANRCSSGAERTGLVFLIEKQLQEKNPVKPLFYWKILVFLGFFLESFSKIFPIETTNIAKISGLVFMVKLEA